MAPLQFQILASPVGHKRPCSGPGSGGRTGSCSDWKITTPLFKQTSAAAGPKLWLHLLFGFHKCFLTAWQVSCLLSHFLFRIPRVGVRGRREILYLFSLTPFRLEAGGVLRLSLTFLKDCNQKSLDPGGPQSCGGGERRRYPAQGHVSKHCWLGGGAGGRCVCGVSITCPRWGKKVVSSCPLGHPQAPSTACMVAAPLRSPPQSCE